MKKIIFAFCWLCWGCFAYLFYGNVFQIMVDPSPAPELCIVHCFKNLDNNFALIFLGILLFLYMLLLLLGIHFKSDLKKKQTVKNVAVSFFSSLLLLIPTGLVAFRLYTTSADQRHGEFVGLLYFTIILVNGIFLIFHSIIVSVFLWLIGFDDKKNPNILEKKND